MAVYRSHAMPVRSRVRSVPKRIRIDVGASLDAAVVAILAAGTLAVTSSGFGAYGGDWAFLASARAASHSGALAVFSALDRNDPGHPISAAVATVAFACFGADPIGYRVALAALAVGIAVALYAALRRCGVPRPYSLAVALIFGVTQNAGNASFSAPLDAELGLALSFASLHAGLSVRGRPARAGLVYALAALVAECATAGCCAAVLPLFFISALVFARRGWASRALGAATVAAMFASLVVHVALAGSGAAPAGALEPSAFAAVRAADLAFGAMVACVGGAAVFVLSLRTGAPKALRVRRFAIAGASASGFAVLVPLAGAIVPALRRSSDDPTGLVTALGFALLVVAGVASCAGLTHFTRRRAGLLAATVAIVCGTVATVASSTARESRAAGVREVRLIADVVDRTAGLPKGALVLIGGSCRTAGSGPFMPTTGEATAALRLVLDRPDVRAAVVSASTLVDRTGIVLDAPAVRVRAGFGEGTIAYDASTRDATPLLERSTARRFAADAKREIALQCAPGARFL